MHTQIDTVRLVFWAFLISAEYTIGLAASGSRQKYLRHYLLSEAMIGTSLWVLSRTIDAWAYFHCWCIGTILDDAASFYLAWSILSQVRVRAIPSRQSRAAIYLATLISFSIGIFTAGTGMTLLSPEWKTILSLDHAFWSGAACLVALTSLYAWLSLSPLPRRMTLTFADFALYNVIHSGLFDLMVLSGSANRFAWISDCVYVLSLLFWFVSTRIEDEQIPEPITAENFKGSVTTE